MMRSIKVLAFAAGLTAAVAHADEYNTLLQRGEAELQSGQYDDAKKTLDGAIRESADNGRAWQLFGRAELLSGNFDGALQAFDKAKEKGVNVNLDVGTAQYQAGDNRSALATLETAVTDDDTNADAHYLYGLALYKAEKYKTAREHFVRARELDADLEAESLVFSAGAASKLGDDETAKKELETAAAIDPEGDAGKAAKKALDAMKGGSAAFQAAVQLATQYDSNVLLVPQTGGLFTASEISNKSGMRLVLSGQLAWMPALTGDWRGLVGYGLYQSLHYTHRDTVKIFDLTNHGLTLGAERKTASAVLSLPYTLSLAYLNTFDENARYATTHSFTPAYTAKFGAHSLGASNAIGYEDFKADPVAVSLKGKEIEQSRDNLFDQLTVFYRLDAAKFNLTPSVGLLYANASGDENSWDNTGARLALQCGFALTKALSLDAGLGYTGRSYGSPFPVANDAGAVHPEDRSDGETGASLGLSYVKGHLNAVAGYSYTRNASTIDTFSYKRSLVTLGVGAQF
jgi:Flp pilus assembly protein TadD